MGVINRLDSGRYQARWRDERQVQRKRTFRTKAEASRFLAEVEVSKARGTYVDDRAGRVTLAEYARQYIEVRPYRPSSARRIRGHLKHIADTSLGAMPLASIRASHIQGWATDRSQHLSPVTMKQLMGLVRSIFLAAVEDRLIGASPVPRRVVLPRPEAAERVVPVTVPEVLRIAREMPARARAMVIVQAGLGLRVQELLALRVSDVDFLRRTVRVVDQLEPRKRTREPLKTPASRRTVPLPAVVADALAAHVDAYGHGGPDGEFFTMDDGRTLWQYLTVWRMYDQAVKAAGVAPQDGTHFLRHHYASVLLEAGESVVVVAARLGHTTAALVLSTYGHLMPNGEDRTRRAVDLAWSAPDVPAAAEASV